MKTDNWLDEIETFTPNRKACVITGTPQERKEQIASIEEYEIAITSYPLIRRDIKEYQSVHFHTVFLDEAQFIKNASSLRTKDSSNLNSSKTLFLKKDGPP